MLRDSVHVQLIVEKLALLVRAFDRRELATTDTIPCGNLGGSVQSHTGTCDDSDSCLHHDLIDDFRVGFHLEVASLSDVHEAGKEGLSWDSELVKLQVAIVNAIVAQLHANITNFDTWQHLMRIEVPDRHKERLYAVVGLE